MESEAVLSQPIEARWLFVTIMLSADDLGLFEATEFRLARRADVNRDAAHKLLQMLADSDLIRLYDVGGKRFGFIPRFRQRVQIKTIRHPLPPEAMLLDDSDALNKIKHLASKPTDGQRKPTVAQPSEVEAEVEDREPNGSLAPAKPVRRPRALGSKTVPDGFAVTPDLEAWAAENVPGVDWRKETEKFRDWEFKHSRVDWAKVWRTWMRRAHETAGDRGESPKEQRSFV